MTDTIERIDYGAIDRLVDGISDLRHLSISATPMANGHAWECLLRGFRRNPKTNISTSTTWRGTGATVEEAVVNAVNAERVHVHRYDAKTSFSSSTWTDAGTLRIG